nr:hypothetical protein [Chloroflexota bacterium]
MDSESKSLENWLRRRAKRLGLALHKSRRSLSIDNLGGYQIIDSHNRIVAGEKFNLELNDVAAFLDDYEA